MACIVKIECQKCETIHEEELEGVLILGNKQAEDGTWGTAFYFHELSTAQALQLVSDALQQLAKEVEDATRGN